MFPNVRKIFKSNTAIEYLTDLKDGIRFTKFLGTTGYSIGIRSFPDVQFSNNIADFDKGEESQLGMSSR